LMQLYGELLRFVNESIFGAVLGAAVVVVPLLFVGVVGGCVVGVVVVDVLVDVDAAVEVVVAASSLPPPPTASAMPAPTIAPTSSTPNAIIHMRRRSPSSPFPRGGAPPPSLGPRSDERRVGGA